MVCFVSYLAYLDDSRDPDWCVVSALVVSANDWPAVFRKIKDFRTLRRDSDGFYMRKEWHASDFRQCSAAHPELEGE